MAQSSRNALGGLSNKTTDRLWTMHDEEEDPTVRAQFRSIISDVSEEDCRQPSRLARRLWQGVLLALVIALGLVLASRGAAAVERINKSWTQITHHKHTVSLSAGRDEARMLSLWEASGVAMMGDPRAATVRLSASADVQEKGGTYVAYSIYEFVDGSTLELKLEADVIERGDGIGNLQKGTITILSGTKRYEGATGAGQFTATQYGAAAENATTIYKMTATIELSGSERTVEN